MEYYNQFLLTVQMEIKKKLGNGFDVRIQRVVKNNDTLLDGLVIRKEQEQLAPTIYLNSYYKDFKQGMEMKGIIDRIMCSYDQNSDISLENGNIEELADFSNLRKKVAYKLVHRDTNQELLKDIPFVSFLDMAIVFYLILDESKNGQITALIHNSHMYSWGITKDELYQLAKGNTPELLPAQIRTMGEIIGELLTGNLGEFGDDEIIDGLLGEKEVPIYILSNKRQVNGACCILYENCLERFAAEQGGDIIILPTSIHETLLIPEREETSYKELSAMVTEINQSEVSEEDRLSNQIYRYSRSSRSIEIVFHSDQCLINRREQYLFRG